MAVTDSVRVPVRIGAGILPNREAGGKETAQTEIIVVRNKDAERWWNTRIGWPMKEVS